jgi:hypothetical protein
MSVQSKAERNWLIGAGLFLVAAVFTGYAIGEGVEAAVVPTLIVAGFLGLIIVGRHRSDSLDSMSGIGDERTRDNNTRATAFAGNLLAWVVPCWWLVTVASGEPNRTLPLIGLIFAIAWIGASIYYSRTG